MHLGVLAFTWSLKDTKAERGDQQSKPGNLWSKSQKLADAEAKDHWLIVKAGGQRKRRIRFRVQIKKF